MKKQDATKLENAIHLYIDTLHEVFGWFDDEALVNTPKRMLRFFQEWEKANDFNFTVFDNGGCDELIVLKNISFYSLCEHHVLPFYGEVSIAYLPADKICGVSKLARAAKQMASRPQVQEKLTQQLADEIVQKTGARFVMVVVKAKHLCMLMRGIKEHKSEMVTSAIRHPDEGLDWKSLKVEAMEMMR